MISAGVLTYADDVVLIAPSAIAMRKMSICDNFADEFSVKFNANNSKYLVIQPRSRQLQTGNPGFIIEGNEIEIVDRWPHLRHITGSAVALHCCKANQRINRKTGNSNLCKILTPENFSASVCTRDYVGDGNYHAIFCENRFSGASPQIGEV